MASWAAPRWRCSSSRRRERKAPRWPLRERGDARIGDLLVLVRLHAGDADGADALVAHEDRQAALDQDSGREAHEGRALLDAVFEQLARPPRQRRGARLADGDFAGNRSDPVHALEGEEI